LARISIEAGRQRSASNGNAKELALRERVFREMVSDDVCRQIRELVTRYAFDHQLALFKRRDEARLDSCRIRESREELTCLHRANPCALRPLSGVSEPGFIWLMQLQQQRLRVVVTASPDGVHDPLKKSLQREMTFLRKNRVAARSQTDPRKAEPLALDLRQRSPARPASL
jgi:hypothetical protein